MHQPDHPLKRFSQNFLANPYYQQRIVEALRINSGDTVLEIGPGRGALSQYIITEKPQRYVAVEIDDRWAKELQQKFGSAIQIINADFMTIDLTKLEKQPGQQLKIIGNIPYHITSPILFRLIDQYQLLHSAVIMTQKEVARRITAQPGNKDYGILSVISQSYAAVEYLFDVTRGNFYPAPKVDSAVIRLLFFENLTGVADEQLYRKLVRQAFNYRRKMLRNSLQNYIEETPEIREIIDLTRRPETLSVEEFKQLANLLSIHSRPEQ